MAKTSAASNSPTAHSRILVQLATLPNKPDDAEGQSAKKRYSEQVSQVLAAAIASEFRGIGLQNTRPNEVGVTGDSGAERRMAGGLGAKKVDVTWASEEAGLLFGVSVKSINFRDTKSKNFQKNLTNRRGDMLFECVTLHRRFPYAVLFGLFVLDGDADRDGTEKRETTFKNAHEHFALFTGRNDPAGRDEQFERLYIALMRMESRKPVGLDIFEVGQSDSLLSFDKVLEIAAELIAKRNPDFYRHEGGVLKRRNGKRSG